MDSNNKGITKLNIHVVGTSLRHHTTLRAGLGVKTEHAPHGRSER